MSFYGKHYQALRPVLFELMQHGVRWDKEGAAAKAEQLESRRRAILAEVEASGLGNLLSVERHRSRLYAKLLEEQRIEKAKPAGERDRKRLKGLAAESRAIRTAGLQTEIVVKGLSDDKLKRYFYITEKVPMIRKRRKAKGASTPTVDDTALLKIKSGYPKYSDLIDKVLEYRRCQKLVSTYLDPGKVDDDGRIRCTYKPHGTQSGRLSSSANPLGTGFNLQNPDGELKYLIIPDSD